MILNPIVGDLHVNSKMALCHPDAGYKRNDFQKWEWYRWLEFWEEVGDLKKRNKCKVISFINGEAGDIDVPGFTLKLYTKNHVEVKDHVAKVLQPVVDVSDGIIFTYGTPAHTGKDSWLDEDIARDHKDIRIPDTREKTNSWMYFYGEFEGVIHYHKHHGRKAHRPWTKGGGVNRRAAEILYAFHEEKLKIPDIAVQNHYHRHADSYKNHPTRVIANYGWQGHTPHANRITDTKAQIGGVIIINENKEYEVLEREYIPPRRKLWTATNLLSLVGNEI